MYQNFKHSPEGMRPASGLASCYFWCTHDGELPQVVGDDSEDYRELLEELAPNQHEIRLRPSFKVIEGPPQSEDEGSHAISSAFVYKILLSSETMEKQDREGNFTSFHYEFERHFGDCKFNFICPSMLPSGQECRDMGIQVSVQFYEVGGFLKYI